MVKISTTNSKLGLIPSVNLPPVITCRDSCPCAKDCYARKGNFRFANVKSSHMANYKAYLDDPKRYFDEIQKFIGGGIVTYVYFRWHSSGDFVDENYFAGVVETAKKLPQTSFLSFTKKYEIVNEYIKQHGELPDNLHIVFSAWGDELEVVNPYELPVAYVRFHDANKDKSIPAEASECSGDCTNCLQCWHIGKGEAVVFNKH